jgi:hypothetical protein
MEQQAITYQYDLFDSKGQDVIRSFVGSEAVSGAQAIKALQVKEAGEEERALTHDLMEGWGSNSPTYSINSALNKIFCKQQINNEKINNLPCEYSLLSVPKDRPYF